VFVYAGVQPMVGMAHPAQVRFGSVLTVDCLLSGAGLGSLPRGRGEADVRVGVRSAKSGHRGCAKKKPPPAPSQEERTLASRGVALSVTKMYLLKSLPARLYLLLERLQH